MSKSIDELKKSIAIYETSKDSELLSENLRQIASKKLEKAKSQLAEAENNTGGRKR